MRRATRVSFTQPELRHIYAILADAKNDGSYYGNRQQYYDRTERIMTKIEEAELAEERRAR